MKFVWYKCEKFFRGGSEVFQIRVPDCKLKTDDWNEIMEWLGDNTNGGHSAGYTINRKKLRAKDATLKIVKYPDYLIPQTIGLGDKVVTTSRWI